MSTITILMSSLLASGVLCACLAFLVRSFVDHRLRVQLAEVKSDISFRIRKREQASVVANFLVQWVRVGLHPGDDQLKYQLMVQYYTLVLWLDTDVLERVNAGLARNPNVDDCHKVLLEVRAAIQGLQTPDVQVSDLLTWL